MEDKFGSLVLPRSKAMTESIGRSFSRYKFTFDRAAIGIAHVSPKGEFIQVNDKLCESLGYSRSELIRLKFKDITHKEDVSKSLAYLKRMINGEIGSFSAEKRYLKKDGSLMWAHLTSSLVRTSANEPAYFISFIEDITERKKAEQALIDSEARFRSLVENAPNIVITANCHGEISFINYTVPGISPEEVLGKSIFDFVRESDREMVRKCLEKVLSTGEPDGYEIAGPENLAPAWYNVRMGPIKNEDRVAGILLVLADITNRIDTESKLKTSNDQLNRMIDGATELIVSINKDGTITSWNKAIANRTGFSKQEISQKNIFKDLIPQQISPLTEHVKSIIKTKKSGLAEIEIANKCEYPIPVLINTSLIKDQDDKIEEIVLIGRDLSSQRNIHKKLITGHSYITFSDSFADISTVLSILHDQGYSLLCVTRGNTESIKNEIHHKASVLLLSQSKTAGIDSESHPSRILNKIHNHIDKNKRSVVLLNRLEYISLLYGFEELVKLLYELNDITQNSSSVVIVRLNKKCFDNREISLIMEEFSDFPNIAEDTHLEAKKIEVLKLISNKNSFHIKVPCQMISSEFGLSKMTTKKWIDELQEKMLIKVDKNGRSKFVYITDYGQKVISKY